jgi:hypothetical protein
VAQTQRVGGGLLGEVGPHHLLEEGGLAVHVVLAPHDQVVALAGGDLVRSVALRAGQTHRKTVRTSHMKHGGEREITG